MWSFIRVENLNTLDIKCGKRFLDGWNNYEWEALFLSSRFPKPLQHFLCPISNYQGSHANTSILYFANFGGVARKKCRGK
jgi:hypothetical protein